MTPSRTSASRQLPTFIIIGAMKAGTTSLLAYLGSHPDVFVTNPKEPRFFGSGDDGNWARGVGWYRQLFVGGEAVTARGEASPGYSMAPHVPHVPERIAGIVPDVKLIYLLRNPVERIRSAYLMRRSRGVELLTLRDAIDAKPKYLDSSRYAYQLERYLDWFPPEQILTVSSERLGTNRVATLRQVCEFVGVDPDAEMVGIDRELNRGIDKRVPVPLYQTMSAPFRASGVDRIVPQRVKRRIRRAMSRQPSPDQFDVPADVAERIWSELAPDLARLRKLVGAEFDLWGRA